jgi:hypothetical protein
VSIWASFCIMDGDCGDPPRPIRYQRSHILPSLDDDRAGHFDLALIPGFITRDGRDDGPEDNDQCWPYLRVSLSEVDDTADVTAVLDVDQVAYLRDQLDVWLNRVHRLDAQPSAGCPVGECVHPGASHEADEYSPDGEPVRPICCAGDCGCGDQWRAPM